MQAGNGGHSIGIGLPLGQVSIAVLGVVGGALAERGVAVPVLAEVDGALGVDVATGALVKVEPVEARVVRF